MKLTLVGAFAATLALGVLGIGDFERGNRLYREGKFGQAAAAYRKAIESGKNTPEVHYNLGTALLGMKRYAEAETELRAALSSVDPELRQRVHYNLGNRFLEEARSAQDQATVPQLLESAIEAYKQSLRLLPADMPSKWNLELALRDQEKDKQQQPQSGNQQDQNQGQNDQEKQQAGGGGNNAAPSSPQNDPGESPQPKPLTDAQADRILSAAEEDERELYKDRLKKGQREMPVLRDW
jgi:Ca-activated chloride channel family protein